MIKSEELRDPNSCINKAANDEPVFVLRANDELAPEVVEVWAARYYAQKGGAKMPVANFQKFNDSMRLASQMRNYKLHGALTAPPPAPTSPTTALSGSAKSSQK